VNTNATVGFAWSPQRHEMFQQCRRRYFFHYYASRNGWKENAPARARELYILKRLSNARQWAGRHVHEAIQQVINSLRRQEPLPAPQGVADAALNAMRQEFKDSRARKYRQNPKKFCGLFEHEYELSVSDSQWKACADGVAESIHAFCQLPVFKHLQQLSASSMLAVEDWVTVELDKLTVKIRLDLVFRDGDILTICDWKTGRGGEENRRLQSACYALCAHLQWRVAPETIKALFIQLPSGDAQECAASADELEETRSFIHDSADEMLFPLADPVRDIPEDEDAFDFTEQPNTCQCCNFLKACPRWQNNLKEGSP
jgi:hypothetical protein